MERPQPTEQQMIALALWWTSAIFGTPLRSNGDTSLQGLMASALQTEIAIAELATTNKETFYRALLAGIQAEPTKQLKVDYHPQGKALVEAAETAKLSDFALPPKIQSWWAQSLQQYKGVNGYGADTEVIA